MKKPSPSQRVAVSYHKLKELIDHYGDRLHVESWEPDEGNPRQLVFAATWTAGALAKSPRKNAKSCGFILAIEGIEDMNCQDEQIYCDDDLYGGKTPDCELDAWFDPALPSILVIENRHLVFSIKTPLDFSLDPRS